MEKVRDFVFTINNWTSEDVEYLKTLAQEAQYMIVGEEVGEKGTPHLQGYIYFKNPRSVKNIVKVLRGHVEVAQGSPLQNYEYCSKQKVLLEYGSRPKGQGKRSDIDGMKDLMMECLANGDRPGRYMKTFWMNAPSYQAYKFAEAGVKIFEEKRDWKPLVKWYWGPTGTGKTRKAVEDAPRAWISGKDLKWWDGYEGHNEVIIDDFRPDFCTFHVLLRILDRYEFRVEVKGSSRQLLAKTIIITCPMHPRVVYNTNENVDQLLRRIDQIVEFGTFGTEQKSGVIISPDISESVPGIITMDSVKCNDLTLRPETCGFLPESSPAPAARTDHN